MKCCMEVIKIDTYDVGPADCFFFDTNVWLYIFAPIGNNSKRLQQKYTALYKDILSRGAKLQVNSLVIAEYINVVLRMAFQQWKREDYNRINADFKRDYRPTQHYIEALSDARDQVNLILSNSTRFPDNFHNIDIDSITNRMSKYCDYKDSCLIQFCEQSGAKLVSHDQDFTHLDSRIKLITA